MLVLIYLLYFCPFPTIQTSFGLDRNHIVRLWLYPFFLSHFLPLPTALGSNPYNGPDHFERQIKCYKCFTISSDTLYYIQFVHIPRETLVLASLLDDSFHAWRVRSEGYLGEHHHLFLTPRITNIEGGGAGWGGWMYGWVRVVVYLVNSCGLICCLITLFHYSSLAVGPISRQYRITHHSVPVDLQAVLTNSISKLKLLLCQKHNYFLRTPLWTKGNVNTKINVPHGTQSLVILHIYWKL